MVFLTVGRKSCNGQGDHLHLWKGDEGLRNADTFRLDGIMSNTDYVNVFSSIFMYDDGNFEAHFFFFSGRPGTLSIQTSRQAARNHSYRCRGIKDGENTFDQHECVFPVYKPCHTALRDGGRIQIIKGINSRNFSRLHIYNTVCHKRPKAACGGCLAPKTSRLQGDDKRL